MVVLTSMYKHCGERKLLFARVYKETGNRELKLDDYTRLQVDQEGFRLHLKSV